MRSATVARCFCGKPAVTRGWCQKHYMRWRRHGDPNYRRSRTDPPKRISPAGYIEYGNLCAVCGRKTPRPRPSSRLGSIEPRFRHVSGAHFP